MRRSPNLIQIDLSNFGYFQTKTKPKRDPITQSLPQFALAASQGLMPGPNTLKAGDFTPVGTVVLNDLVFGDLHRNVKEVCKHKSSLLRAR